MGRHYQEAHFLCCCMRFTRKPQIRKAARDTVKRTELVYLNFANLDYSEIGQGVKPTKEQEAY